MVSSRDHPWGLCRIEDGYCDCFLFECLLPSFGVISSLKSNRIRKSDCCDLTNGHDDVSRASTDPTLVPQLSDHHQGRRITLVLYTILIQHYVNIGINSQ